MCTLSAVLSSCHVYTIVVFGAGGVAICRRIRWDKVASDPLLERIKLGPQLNVSNINNAAVLNTYIVWAIFNVLFRRDFDPRRRTRRVMVGRCNAR